MNCLFIVENDPISRNYSGGSSICFDHLTALKALGVNITILHYADSMNRKIYNEFYEKNPDELALFEKLYDDLIEIEIKRDSGLLYKLKNTLINLKFRFVFRMSYYFLPVIIQAKSIINKNKIDFIWAQHLIPSVISININDVPVISIHHDWQYKVKALKNNVQENNSTRKTEEKICKKASAVISSSFSEYKEISGLGITNAFYIPITYPVVSTKPLTIIPDIIHLGGMNTTANVIGLENFINHSWDKLGISKERLIIIGKLNGATQKLQNQIKEFKWVGFVHDLDSVLKRGDIHIIPWHKNTGTRTRIPLALSYGQIIVAIEESVKCFPELINGLNCFLVKDLDEMALILTSLMNDIDLREKISQNAIKTFQKCFTTESQTIRYQSVFTALFAKNQEVFI